MAISSSSLLSAATSRRTFSVISSTMPRQHDHHYFPRINSLHDKYSLNLTKRSQLEFSSTSATSFSCKIHQAPVVTIE
jgi:hypothetical protein